MGPTTGRVWKAPGRQGSRITSTLSSKQSHSHLVSVFTLVSAQSQPPPPPPLTSLKLICIHSICQYWAGLWVTLEHNL